MRERLVDSEASTGSNDNARAATVAGDDMSVIQHRDRRHPVLVAAEFDRVSAGLIGSHTSTRPAPTPPLPPVTIRLSPSTASAWTPRASSNSNALLVLRVVHSGIRPGSGSARSRAWRRSAIARSPSSRACKHSCRAANPAVWKTLGSRRWWAWARIATCSRLAGEPCPPASEAGDGRPPAGGAVEEVTPG